MPRRYHGQYSRKHPCETVVPPQLGAAVKSAETDGSITCKKAHAVARDMAVDPAAVGQAADMLHIRIIRCQLGLFAKKSAGSPSNDPSAMPNQSLWQSIDAALVDGRLPCTHAWDLSDRLHLTRAEVGALCEHLGIKISQCQLGAF